jgi:hypothetical protein
MRSSGKTIAAIAAGVLAGIAVILLVGIVLSAVLGESSPPTTRVGIAMTGGRLVVYGCEDEGIGSAEIQVGRQPGGALAWSAAKEPGATGLRMLPLGSTAAGYTIRGSGLEPRDDRVLALRSITDSRGESIDGTYLVFRPARLSEGTIIASSGRAESLSRWLEKVRTC